MVDTPYQYIDNTGVVVPDTSAILSEVQAEFKAAFGADLVVTPDTPQGVLITAEAISRNQEVNNNAALANQINPNIAGGVFLDAIMALTGMQRAPATKTAVIAVNITGVAGAVIPQGSQASTSTGDLFAVDSTVTIGIDGTIIANFSSVEFGPVPCPIAALTMIVTNILGWETVTNPSVGILGTTTQSDQQTRVLRSNTLAFQGVALPVAITSALYATDGVRSLSFLENISANTQTIQGISMVGHSIYTCIDGGTDTDVAAALLENKSSGCNWNGNTSVEVIEPASGQPYTVLFDRPEVVGILIKVTTSNGNSNNIIQAILDYADGLTTGFLGFVVGADVSPFEIMAGIAAEFPSYYISNVQISLTSPVDYTNTPIAIAPNQIAHTQTSFISVVIA